MKYVAKQRGALSSSLGWCNPTAIFRNYVKIDQSQHRANNRSQWAARQKPVVQVPDKYLTCTLYPHASRTDNMTSPRVLLVFLVFRSDPSASRRRGRIHRVRTLHPHFYCPGISAFRNPTPGTGNGKAGEVESPRCGPNQQPTPASSFPLQLTLPWECTDPQTFPWMTITLDYEGFGRGWQILTVYLFIYFFSSHVISRFWFYQSWAGVLLFEENKEINTYAQQFWR